MIVGGGCRPPISWFDCWRSKPASVTRDHLHQFAGCMALCLGIDDGFLETIADAGDDEETSRKGVRKVDEDGTREVDDEVGGGSENEPFDRASGGVFWSPAVTGTSLPFECSTVSSFFQCTSILCTDNNWPILIWRFDWNSQLLNWFICLRKWTIIWHKHLMWSFQAREYKSINRMLCHSWWIKWFRWSSRYNGWIGWFDIRSNWSCGCFLSWRCGIDFTWWHVAANVMRAYVTISVMDEARN